MRRASATAVLLAAVVTMGCGSSGQQAPSTTLTISAAASLTDAFTEIAQAFQDSHPGTSVRLNFAGSSTLAEQINAGAPVDVFAAASPETMQRAVDTGAVGAPAVFTTNSLAIAVPAGNPAGVSSLADLEDPAATIVVCAAQVPCGAATSELFSANELAITPASLEPDVRAVLTKVVADEADAGIVYRTDLLAADVTGIEIPQAMNVANDYLIAPADQAPGAAGDFVDFVLSEQGQRILAEWGFAAP